MIVYKYIETYVGKKSDFVIVKIKTDQIYNDQIKELNSESLFQKYSKDKWIKNEIIAESYLMINNTYTMKMQLVFYKESNESTGAFEIIRDIQSALDSKSLEDLIQKCDDLKILFVSQMNHVFDDKDIKLLYQQLESHFEIQGNLMQELQQFYEKRQGVVPDIKHLLNNPRQIVREDVIKSYPWNEWIFSYKADGVRCLCYSSQQFMYLITEKKTQKYEKIHLQQFIVECEIVNKRLLIYDLHMLNQEQIYKKPYIERLNLLQKQFQDCILPVIQTAGMTAQIKEYTQILSNRNGNKLRQCLEHYARMEDTDGIVINQNGPYFEQQILKWKPQSKLTVDFYIEKTTSDRSGVERYILYSYVDKNTMFRLKLQDLQQAKINTSRNIYLIPFQSSYYIENQNIYYRKTKPDNHQIDKKVCEFTYNTKKNKWKLYRIRDDKDPEQGQYGNHITVAEQILLSMIYFLDLQNIYDMDLNNMYFEREKPQQYRQMTRYMNFIKQHALYRVLIKNGSVVDLGCGKGQDILKYAFAGVSKAFMVDNDMDALQELIKRKNNTKNLQFGNHKISVPSLQVFRVNLNIKVEFQKFIQPFQAESIDSIVSNFAIHYFIENLQLVVDLAVKSLRKGGRIMISILDGERVLNLLKLNNNMPFVLLENDQEKYRIELQEFITEENTLTGFQASNAQNQTILIKLPFSQELRKEPIIRESGLIEAFEKNGLAKKYAFNFDEVNWISDSTQRDVVRKKYQELNEVDKTYVGLYKCFIFEKC